MSPPIALGAGLEPFPGLTTTRILGRGAWGEVWQAKTSDGQRTALKFLPCDCHHKAAMEIRGLQSIRNLQHPHLIRIDQIWCWAGHVVISMELAEGSLLDLLEICLTEFGAGVAPDHLCYFLGQAAEALDFLNTRQHILNDRRVAVRHCDVKPSNMLVLQGKMKLADFSLAAQTTSSMWYHHRTGTLDYSAPEVFQGWLSDRTDQYALAVSYIELRTGKLPFRDTPPNFTKAYKRPEPDLSNLEPWERPILKKALNPVPQDRWPSCKSFMEQFDRGALHRSVAQAASLPQ